MKAVVFAYSNIGCAGLKTLVENGVEVTAVFTHADSPDENVWFASVAETAARLNIPVYAPEDVNNPAWVDRIRALEPDCLFSFYYRQLLREPVLSIPKLGAFNLHGSLLPKYRGRCPVNWVLLHGEKETGLTLHAMTKRPDDGDIIGQTVVAIDDEDTAKSLNEKMTAAVPAFLAPLLPAIAAGNPPRQPQRSEDASYFGGRRPNDGLIDWNVSAEAVRNLVRAVARPYPGAFSYSGPRKLFVWKAVVEKADAKALPGTVVDTEPLRIACGEGVLRIELAQEEGGVDVSGFQIARDMNLVPGMRLTKPYSGVKRKTRIFIIGANGFIGNALVERLLADGGFEVHAFDRSGAQLSRFMGHKDFHFIEGDMTIHRDTIRYEISLADVVLPLAAIATPVEYVRNPLRVFELDFEENLRIVRDCAEFGKRIIFPSTSEVYGMAEDEFFDEDCSSLIVGPIRNQRWIYSSSKQLLDRVIWAYGWQRGLKFTLFRPFNWVGPRLDSLQSARNRNSRVITQMILNLVEGTPILLVDGGEQKRCFTALQDGIEGLFQIIVNKNNACDGEIMNLGNPDGELSIRELGEVLVAAFERHPLRQKFPPFAGFRAIEAAAYYGQGYQDVKVRRPSVRKAGRILGWKPETDPRKAVEETLDFFVRAYLDEQ